jgi:anaerobic magnesium-protoporphyrin IX monomethyl ester cyclase
MEKEKREVLDCLLVSPPMWLEASENIWGEISSDFPSLGIASLAGYARSRGYSVKIIDCVIEAPSLEKFRSFFKTNYVDVYGRIKVIGFTSVTYTIKKAYRLAEICKQYYPDALVVFGGVHATFVTDEVISQPFVDIAVIGEGELTLVDILAGKPRPEIKGIVFKKSAGGAAKTIKNPPRERIFDLDALPMPAYDLLPVLKYRPAKGSYLRLPAMAMMTSRGCPGRCTFCAKTLGTAMVFRSAEKIYEEIKFLMTAYGIREIMFYDDTFTCHRQNVLKVCDLLIAHDVDLAWNCFARVDFIDEELLGRMKAAGCHQIMYGVENIDDNVLKNINKKINAKQVEQAVRWTKAAGIECRLAFMVGNPGDTREVVEKNIDFAIKTDPDLMVMNIATPFPGTEMYKWAKERGLILTDDWNDYNLSRPVMRLENLSALEIERLYRLAYRRFYFRPKIIARKLFSVRSWDQFFSLFDGFKSLVRFSLGKIGVK